MIDVLLLSMAVIDDLRFMRISYRSCVLFGLYAFLTHGFDALVYGYFCFLIGFCLQYMNVVGGGDSKMFFGVGGLLGLKFVFFFLFLFNLSYLYTVFYQVMVYGFYDRGVKIPFMPLVLVSYLSSNMVYM